MSDESHALPPEIAAQLRIFDKATIRLGILRDRMEACNPVRHELSRDEIPAWIEEQQEARSALETAITALVRDGERLTEAVREAIAALELEPGRTRAAYNVIAALTEALDAASTPTPKG